MRELELGSVFSGIGALDLGLVLAGLKLKWQCENDLYCRKILKKRFGVKVYRDARKSQFTSVDVLAGGFPCQPISQAGQKLYDQDERWLWPYFLEVIYELSPRWVVIENVEGLRTRGIDEILKGLSACGYDAEWDRIPASIFGAPHIRHRYFIFAYPESLCWERGSYLHHFGRLQWEQFRKAIKKGKIPSNDMRDGCQTGSEFFRESFSEYNASNPNCFFAYPYFKRLQILGIKGKVKAVAKESAINGYGWWGIEPDVGRMVYGTPYRLDRLKSIGNAVIPPAGYFMGRLVQFAESQQEGINV